MANHGRRYTWKTPTPTPSHAAPGVVSRGSGVAGDDNNNGFELEWRKYTMAELLLTLSSSPSGLTSAFAAARLRRWGGNELETKNQNLVAKLLPVAVEAAAAVAMFIGLARGGGAGGLGFFNALVALIAADLAVDLAENYSAGISAANALVARLAPSRRACWLARDGTWSAHDAAAAVPGDVIWIRSGDVVLADARFLETQPTTPMNMKMDESALTGDPLPWAKRPGDAVYAGSVCVEGEAAAVVVAGGGHTYLADGVRLADATNDFPLCRAVFRVLKAIWNACVVASCFLLLVAVVVEHESISAVDVGELAVYNGLLFGFTGALLSIDWESKVPERPDLERDPEELMRRLERLREQGKISEETVERCRELFGMEPVCDELVAELARHFGWVN